MLAWVVEQSRRHARDIKRRQVVLHTCSTGVRGREETVGKQILRVHHPPPPTMSAATTTTAYSSPIQSSFAVNALTTTFTPPATCTGAYYSNGIYVLGESTDCRPSGFADTSTDYFSPGLACPSGYHTACHDNAGVSSITTVTCCPFIGDISLGCVTPSTLSDVWSTLFCTWIAPDDAATTVSLTLSDEGTTSTVSASVSSPGGLNAKGIRMVYQATDLSTTSSASSSGTSVSATATATATSTGASATSTGSADDGSSDSGDGLSAGTTAAIAVVVSVLGTSSVIGAFFWMRRRKQRQAQQQYGAVGPHSPTAGATPPHPTTYKYTGQYDPATSQELSGVGAHGVRNQQQELAELGPQHNQQLSELGSSPAVELPASNNWR